MLSNIQAYHTFIKAQKLFLSRLIIKQTQPSIFELQRFEIQTVFCCNNSIPNILTSIQMCESE